MGVGKECFLWLHFFLTFRKSQAQKFNDSIEGFEKQKSQTVKVLRDAISEMKAYIDKELEAVSKKQTYNLQPLALKEIFDKSM